MQLEILVEEPSAEEALRHILPKLVLGRARVKLVSFGSKSRLLKQLRNRLLAYHDRIRNGEDLRVLVLVDRDQDECTALKASLERTAHECKLPTKTRPDRRGRFLVVNRIAVEELEAWFLGDPEALRSAFRGLPQIHLRGPFRNPDNTPGGAWEGLHRFLKEHGIYRSSYPKIEAAKRIAPHLELGRNRSRSFQAFCGGVEALLSS